MDDFNGKCSNGGGVRYPLIRALADGLGGAVKDEWPTTVPTKSTTAFAPTTAVDQSNSAPPLLPTTSSSSSSSNANANPASCDISALCALHGSGFFAGPCACSQFYRCHNGVGYQFSCPAGLVFDTQLNTCNYAYAATCTL